MALVEEWQEIQQRLGEAWQTVTLGLTPHDGAELERLVGLLTPARPSRREGAVRFVCARGGEGVSPEGVRRLLARIDADRIGGRLAVLDTGERASAPADPRPTLAMQWDTALAALPSDWSDLYGEIGFLSSDYLERGALLMAPLNPARVPGAIAHRFRCARSTGYGASSGMVRRCFERMDGELIRGRVEILRALSNTRSANTQGPVWIVGGRSV